jgi:hypothetical protein
MWHFDIYNVHNLEFCQAEGKTLFGRLSIDGRMGTKCILGKYAGRVWGGFTWLKIVTSGGQLWTW